MSHRIGSVLATAPVIIGPASGEASTSPNTWERVFSPPPAPNGGTKFLMLHFTAMDLPGSNHLEVDLGYDQDVVTSASGADFWTRPVAGNSVTIRYVDDGVGPPAGGVTLAQFGRGEGLLNGGANATQGGNANGDVFLLDSSDVTPHQEPSPTVQEPMGKFPVGSDPTWLNVAALPNGIQKETARRVGMYITAHDGDMLSTCTATLIDADLVISAGHCVLSEEEARSGSITFDFQTNADGTKPNPYAPKFHKLKRIVRRFYEGFGLDYVIMQIETPPGGLGLTPVALRETVPPDGESLFIVHHPRAAPKKISRQPEDTNCAVGPATDADRVYYQCDIDNGSSGSSVFDSNGEIVANVSWWDNGSSIIAITQDFLTEPEPPRDVDVMVIFDRSGSMSLPGLSGQTKLKEAQDAASLFVQLLKPDAGHRAGLVSFSTAASDPVDFDLADVNAGNKNSLIGPVPFTTGIGGGLHAGGNTSIGDGLQAALGQFPTPAPDTNAPTILLMTDGLQNTPPMIEAAEDDLGETQLSVIGFGTEANLDGPLLTTLARDHGGIYTHSGDGLALKKFFVLSFGNIFDAAISLDPEFVLPAGARDAKPLTLHVCDEDTLTVVLGWTHPEADLLLSLRTPGGNTISAATPGAEAATGDTWTFLRLKLPFNGEREGVWQIQVSRAVGTLTAAGAPAGREERFFVTSVVDGGPYFRPLAQRRLYYTGDTINPLVELRERSGALVHDADVKVEVIAPTAGTGNILAKAGLQKATVVGGDSLDARTSTLIALEQAQAGPLVTTTTQTFPLFDDAQHEDGAMEEDGIYGNPLPDLTRVEGNYTFHALARFGEECIATRETSWSTYVRVGIDPDKTETTSSVVGVLPDGRQQVRVTFTPRDKYGNFVGPGRLGSFSVDRQPGSELIGWTRDAGDGSYVQEVAWQPGSAAPAGITLTQPGRPPIAVCEHRHPEQKPTRLWEYLFWLMLLIVILLLLLLFVWRY
jgi:hypothetical protein